MAENDKPFQPQWYLDRTLGNWTPIIASRIDAEREQERACRASAIADLASLSRIVSGDDDWRETDAAHAATLAARIADAVDAAGAARKRREDWQ